MPNYSYRSQTKRTRLCNGGARARESDGSTSLTTTSSTLYLHPSSVTETESAAPRTLSIFVLGGWKELGKKRKGLGSYSTGSLCRLQRHAREFSLQICGPKASKKRIHTPQGKLRNPRNVTEVISPTQSAQLSILWTFQSTTTAAQSKLKASNVRGRLLFNHPKSSTSCLHAISQSPCTTPP